MQHKWKILLVTLCIFIGLTFSYLASSKAALPTFQAESISVFSLLADPEKYLLTEVVTTGFFVDLKLFPFEIDNKLSRLENSISVAMLDQASTDEFEHCMGLNVKIVGTVVQTSPLVMASIKIIDTYDEEMGYRGCYTYK
ncbi:hypothetical protein CWE15_11785 [Aliidiomarina taiwanensis]|uniref:Uncharacterized protein n=1 Tax=Aliidiomarina taiwanensis TaxID=946228 RepID=A0A432WTF8_9GAMM|nr:hypothetical protein [Aliidiomarina taiwanensis]RUO37061.1 hypothetical protein CWE15_11785 [Aliidiomarina taiwanensis]